MQVGIILNGIESIREMEKYCAPVLIGLSAALLGWAYLRAGGFGPMLSASSQFVPGGVKEGKFWVTFFPALTANVGFWATLSLNIPGMCSLRNILTYIIMQNVGSVLNEVGNKEALVTKVKKTLIVSLTPGNANLRGI